MPSRRRARAILAGGSVLALALLSLLSLGARAVQRDLARPLSVRGSGYSGSETCKPCHAGNYASWHRTFHRTMTQEATEQSVLGAFDGRSLRYMGIEARMKRDPTGHFVIEWSRGGGAERWSATVERTVGSRRYQQYLARDRDLYYRLPVAWNIGEQRFMHVNGAFLTPDPVPSTEGAPITRADYDRHVTRWNDNCIYCHNVAPSPGLDPASGRFDSHVAELGIACEACHGPAQDHAQRNANPLRRFALHLSERRDPSVVNPKRLAPERSAEVCGHCHGQRIAPDIEAVHRTGDRFLPGEELSRYSRPLARETALHGQPLAFAARFWPDGTARLTAYEYQGLLQSPCAQQGGLTCTDCHAMHAGDPRGQLRPDRPGDTLCTACHDELAGAQALRDHARHDPAGPGARCVACHMPKIVYGLVGVHRSHRIDVPDPARSTASSSPDACTLCHVDEGRGWAAAALDSKAPARRSGEERSEVTRLLFAGDPIERSVAADALGRREADSSRAALGSHLGQLLDVMQADPYPAVRSIAWRSLRSLLELRHRELLPDVTAFTATDTQAERSRAVSALEERWPARLVREPETATRELRAQQPEVQVFIGE